MRILIDPAHGGNNIGHVSPQGVVEKQATLAAAHVMQTVLGQHFVAVLSREGDADLSHTDRARMAADYDATLSLHFHCATNPHQRTVAASARIKPAEALGRLVLDNIAKRVPEPVEYKPTMNRITHSDRLVVILVGGLMSNPFTEASLSDGTRYSDLACAVRDALLRHCGEVE